MKMNKRGDINDVLLWIFFGLILFILLSLLINLFNTDKDNVNTCEEKCKKECQKFDYTFYKIENCYLRWERCWCYDENHKPKDIGSLPQ